MNGFCRRTSALVHCRAFKQVFENGAMSNPSPWNQIACDPEHASPQRLRTEARIVRTGLRLSTGSSRSIRKPDLKHDLEKPSPAFRKDHAQRSRPAANKNEQRGIREAGHCAGLRYFCDHNVVCHSIGTCS
jgi:hypothetical protein